MAQDDFEKLKKQTEQAREGGSGQPPRRTAVGNGGGGGIWSRSRGSSDPGDTSWVLLAQEEARRLGHNFVGTEILLLGLLAYQQGVAYKALNSCGVTLADARVEVENVINRGSGYVAQEIPFTQYSKQVVERAWQEARERGHGYLGTEHILLAMLEVNGIAQRVLENLNVDMPSLRTTVIAMIEEG